MDEEIKTTSARAEVIRAAATLYARTKDPLLLYRLTHEVVHGSTSQEATETPPPPSAVRNMVVTPRKDRPLASSSPPSILVTPQQKHHLARTPGTPFTSGLEKIRGSRDNMLELFFPRSRPASSPSKPSPTQKNPGIKRRLQPMDLTKEDSEGEETPPAKKRKA